MAFLWLIDGGYEPLTKWDDPPSWEKVGYVSFLPGVARVTVQLRSPEGETPLHLAARRGVEVLQLLLAHPDTVRWGWVVWWWLRVLWVVVGCCWCCCCCCCCGCCCIRYCVCVCICFDISFDHVSSKWLWSGEWLWSGVGHLEGLELLDLFSCFRAFLRNQNVVRTEEFGINSCVTLKKMESYINHVIPAGGKKWYFFKTPFLGSPVTFKGKLYQLGSFAPMTFLLLHSDKNWPQLHCFLNSVTIGEHSYLSHCPNTSTN